MNWKGSIGDVINSLLPCYSDPNWDPSLVRKNCVERYLNKEENNEELAMSINDAEIIDAFVKCCLHLLLSVVNCFATPPTDGLPLLSLHQTKQLGKCLEFIVCLGVYPRLSKGVSAPLETRMESWHRFACPSQIDTPNRHQMLSEVSIVRQCNHF